MTVSDPLPIRQFEPRHEDRAAAPAPLSSARHGEGSGRAGPAPQGEAPPPEPILPPKPEPPLLKRIERGVTALFKLGRTEAMAKRATRALQRLEPDLHRLRGVANDVDDFGRRIEDARRKAELAAGEAARLRDEYEAVARSRGNADLALNLLARRVDAHDRALRTPPEPPRAEPARDLETQDFLDRFYNRLEAAYRGSEETIAERLSVYLPDMRAAAGRTGGRPVMDLGCGRGEWLALLREEGIDGIGIDTNSVQLEGARARGLDVREDDALAALAAQDPGSLSAVTAHHLVEHLPFETVARLTRASFRALAPGGVLLFETPDTRNVLVGATTFHTDPTHIKPMPDQVLHVLLETAGFDPVERRRLNPHERLDEFLSREGFDRELAQLMFGPQDLAVLGVKPAGEAPAHAAVSGTEGG